MRSMDRSVEELSYNGLKYLRYADDIGHTPRGTVVLFDASGQRPIRTVPGFPHIKRVYRLHQGIQRFFHTAPFFAEEKLDGYNVRILVHQGKVLAITRGGFICPFTSEWAEEIWWYKYKLNRFFASFPDHILFCEVLGDNPYNPQRDPLIPPGLSFFVFEIAKPDGEFMRVRDRYEIVNSYGLPSVPLLGQFSLEQIDRLYAILLDLNDREREGVVLKSNSGNRALKFVTPLTDLKDIKDNLILEFDLEPGFITNRLLRISLFVREFKLDESKYAHLIGKAFLDGYAPLESFEGSREKYTIYVKNLRTWNALRNLIQTHVSVKTESIEHVVLENTEMFKIEFYRLFRKSTRRFREILKGYGHID